MTIFETIIIVATITVLWLVVLSNKVGIFLAVGITAFILFLMIAVVVFLLFQLERAARWLAKRIAP